MADTIEYLQSEDGGSDVLKALSLIANNLKEDRAGANSYSNYITCRRIGNRTRIPRRPQVANPFTYVGGRGSVEMVVIPPTETDPESMRVGEHAYDNCLRPTSWWATSPSTSSCSTYRAS